MTFADFVLSKTQEDSPEGDFARDTRTLKRRGPLWSEDTWESVEAFMLLNCACDQAIKTAAGLFNKYTTLRYA